MRTSRPLFARPPRILPHRMRNHALFPNAIDRRSLLIGGCERRRHRRRPHARRARSLAFRSGKPRLPRCGTGPGAAGRPAPPGYRCLGVPRPGPGPGDTCPARRPPPHHRREPAAPGDDVHWHGVRVPNAMDGAPYVTQPPIQPGETFLYEFAVPDAGTYWYHPHLHSAEQVGRGLYGRLIVEEPEPPQVDRDVVWVLGDFRLNDDAPISGGFNNMDSMSGRVGNTVTINGRFPTFSGPRRRTHSAAPDQRRACPDFWARIQGPPAARDRLRRAAGRAAQAGGRARRARAGDAHRSDPRHDREAWRARPVIDTFLRGLEYSFVDLSKRETAREPGPSPRRSSCRQPAYLSPTCSAERHEVTLTGGMMGAMGMGGGGMSGADMME